MIQPTRSLAELGIMGASATLAMVTESIPQVTSILREGGPWAFIALGAYFLLKFLMKDVKSDLEEILRVVREIKETKHNAK